MKNLDIKLAERLDNYSNIDAASSFDLIETVKSSSDVDLANAELKLAEQEAIIANIEFRLANANSEVANYQVQFDSLNNEIASLEREYHMSPNFMQTSIRAKILNLKSKLPDYKSNLDKAKVNFSKIEYELVLAKANLDKNKSEKQSIKGFLSNTIQNSVVSASNPKPSIKSLMSKGISVKKDLVGAIKPNGLIEIKKDETDEVSITKPENAMISKDVNTSVDSIKSNKILGMSKMAFGALVFTGIAVLSVGGLFLYKKFK